MSKKCPKCNSKNTIKAGTQDKDVLTKRLSLFDPKDRFYNCYNCGHIFK